MGTLITGSIDEFIKRVFIEVDEIEVSVNNKTAREGWHMELISLVDTSDKFRQAFDHIIGHVLMVIKRLWDNFPLEFRMKYSNNFYEFAYKTTELKATTVDNYISTARAYEDFEVFYKVQVPVRDAQGREMVVNGKAVIEEVEFDIRKISPSKLAVCAPMARNGTLADDSDLLAMLMDKYVTVDKLQHSVYVSNDPTKPRKSLYYTISGNYIIAHEGEDEVEIAEIDWANLVNSELARKAVLNMLGRLGINTSSADFMDMWNDANL